MSNDRIEKGPTVVALATIADATPRLPEHGRIRLGAIKKSRAGKDIPTSLDTWRITSPDKDALEVLAEEYGGTVKPWNNAKANPPKQHELLTTTNTLNVLLPQDSLSCWYEEWTGGGCARRCDGVNVEIAGPGGDGPMVVPCLCQKAGKMQCRPYTRLNVIFPKVEFGGYWRMETKGWNAMRELPAMEQILAQLRAVGIIQAKLILEQRQSQGGSKKFVVPKIQIPKSVMQIMQGAASLAGIPTSPVQGELEQGAIDVDAFIIPEEDDGLDPGRPFGKTQAEDEIIDAEIVDETDEEQLIHISYLCHSIGTQFRQDETTVEQGLVHAATKGATLDPAKLTPAQAQQVITVAGQILDGKYELLGFEPSGRIKLKKNPNPQGSA